MGRPNQKINRKTIKRIKQMRSKPLTLEQKAEKELLYNNYLIQKELELKQYKSLSEEDRKLYSTIELEAITWKSNSETAGSLARKILYKLGKWNYEYK